LALDCRLAFAVTARADYLVANVVQVHDGDTITVSLAGLRLARAASYAPKKRFPKNCAPKKALQSP